MDAKIRRLEVNLVTMGTGVAVFGLWTIIRCALTLFIFDDQIAGMVPANMKVAVYFVVGVIVTVVSSFQVYVGFSARGEGKGKHKSVVYLVFAGIGIFIDVVFSGPQIISMFIQPENDWITVSATLIVEITSITCTLIMMTSSIRLRRIRKSMVSELKGGEV